MAAVVNALDLTPEKIKADVATVRNYVEAQRVSAGFADFEHELGLARRIHRDLDRQLAARTLHDCAKGTTTIDQGLATQVSQAANRVTTLGHKVCAAQAAKETVNGIEEEFPELIQR